MDRNKLPKPELLIVDLPEESPSGENKRFFLVLTTSALIVLSLSAALNVYINPWGNYGDTGVFSLYNDRIAKSEYLIELNKKGELKPIENLILGPSTVMPISPKQVEELWGGKAYNLGCFFAGGDENESWLRFLKEELDYKPKRIIVGIETWIFSKVEDGPLFYKMSRRRILNAPRLAKFVEGYSPFTHNASKVFDAISWNQLKYAWPRKSQDRKKRKSYIESKVFTEGGTAHAYDVPAYGQFVDDSINVIYEKKASGQTYTPEEEKKLESVLSDRPLVPLIHIRRYCPGESLSQKRLDNFNQLMEYCEKNEIEMIPVLMPIHPYFYDLLVEKTSHAHFLKQIREHMNSHTKKYKWVHHLVDASHIRNFNGTPRSFHDRYHVGPGNAKLMMNFVFKESRK